MRIASRHIILSVLIFLFWSAFLSSSFAAVKPPYFIWWGNPKDVSRANFAAPGPPEDIGYWQSRGGLDAGHVGVGSGTTGYFDHGQADRMRARMEELVGAGFKGITLEIERPTDAEDAAALRAFKAAHPDVFVVAWLLGSDNKHDYAALKGGIDLFIYEVYLNYGHSYQDFDDFINLATKHGILEKSVFGLGASGGMYAVTPQSIESQFTYIRKKAPEMPGVAVFPYEANNALNTTLDDMYGKYFVNPVFTVKPADIVFSNPNPKPNETITIQAKIDNIGTTAGAGAVTFYDGDPDAGGALIGTSQSVTVPPNSSGTVGVPWQPQSGIHEVYVKIADSPSYTVLEPTANKTVAVTANWWDSRWRYRLPMIVTSKPYDRTDLPIDQSVDFTSVLKSVSENKAFDPDSVRVVEYNANGDVVGERPSQLEPDPDFNAAGNAKAKVTWMLDGNTPAGSTRYYYIYFDAMNGTDKPQPSYPAPVTRNNLTFTGDYYTADLDPSKGYIISSLIPAGSRQNVMGSNGWYFQSTDNQGWHGQQGGAVLSTNITEGGVYTKVEVVSLLGLGRLKTTYYFYGRGAPLKIRREWGPAPGLSSLLFSSAAEMTSGIPQRGGTWRSGHAAVEFSGRLLENNVKEYYFGGQLGPGYEGSAGWFDWSWTEADNSGLGVAVQRRWQKTGSYAYDLTRYYDGQDYLQVWQVADAPTTLDQTETSELYLVPHSYQDLTDVSKESPTRNVWQQAREPQTVMPPEIQGVQNPSAPAPQSEPAREPDPEPSPAPATPPAQQPRVDHETPVVTMTAPPLVKKNAKKVKFTPRWAAIDPSGVSSYSIKYRTGRTGWRYWKTNTRSTSETFTGRTGTTYYFVAESTDGAGNVGSSPVAKTAVRRR